jgi:hypothetical protein
VLSIHVAKLVQAVQGPLTTGLRGWGPTISEVVEIELRIPIRWTWRAGWARAT